MGVLWAGVSHEGVDVFVGEDRGCVAWAGVECVVEVDGVGFVVVGGAGVEVCPGYCDAVTLGEVYELVEGHGVLCPFFGLFDVVALL